jgi:ectoine hydroxylase-related dioxygenase (phytanoyl-CoA dioxygenase family)
MIHEVLNILRKEGICILRDYWNKEKCDMAIKELSKAPLEAFSSGQGGDLRLRPSEPYSLCASDFKNDKFIYDIAKQYSNCHLPENVQSNVVKFAQDSPSDSGGGWHLDSQKPAQFKSMIYLTNVKSENGPFMFLRGSKARNSELPFFSNLRLEDSYIRNNFGDDKIVEVTGNAGTCVLFDSTYVHRGKEISEGIRIAMTTYWYPIKEVEHLPEWNK